MAANVRKAVAEGRSDCIPIFLSEIPLLFTRKIVKPDVCIIQVTDHSIYEGNILVLVIKLFELKLVIFCPLIRRICVYNGTS